ncbi:MAG TPA: tRNA preQ1(34) S-adenosylmethionine ribosyltransferase-isomerase QueA [Gemmatimonadaceae bacterium]|nr:tRNA preQ1(34) S-adenosylmethionine ribosyltransferase-isomerase QueA [Gemmatimonadaceae bacterium]
MTHAPGTRTSDYDFPLPESLIAQHPLDRRDASRLMVVERASGRISHTTFRHIADLADRGDALVLNTSRVIKARLLGARASGAPAEILLLSRNSGGSWDALVKPGAKMRPGHRVRLADEASVIVGAVRDAGVREVTIDARLPDDEVIERFGHVPLPPYITRADAADDAERYQTVYARERGSVAAPTAGLHFTPALLESLASKGVERIDVTLHVGAGTFRPVEHDDPAQHVMHHESFTMAGEAAAKLNAVRTAKGNVWAVGTTSLRVLESVVDAGGHFHDGSGTTGIFIRPPHVVKGADRLITNFHLPRSTLLMLVAAFAGFELTKRAYEVAVAEGYRFYSYGDAMCII